MNTMSRHMKRLDTVSRRVMRSTVTYRRGNVTETMLATIGRSDHQQMGLDGHVTAWRSVDFIFTGSELECSFGVPERGDIIESDHDGEMREYELVPADESEHLYRRCDEFGHGIRVHTTPNADHGEHS